MWQIEKGDKTMNPKEVLEWLIRTLNITNITKLIAQDIENELVQLAEKGLNLAEFKQFILDSIKNRSYDDYKKTKLELYFIMVQDFENSKFKLLTSEKASLRYFADNLGDKVADVFLSIKNHVECDKGGSIDSQYSKRVIFNAFGNNPKELQVLKLYGNKHKIFKYFNCLYPDRENFKDILYRIVCGIRLGQKNPNGSQLEYKDKEVIKRIGK